MLSLLLACAVDVTQTPACATFVACQRARDAVDGQATDVDRFDRGGDCWGSPAGQELCDHACENGLAFLRERYTDLPDSCVE